jgi:hypothetical protein
MGKRPVDVDPGGENVEGESTAEGPEAVTDEATVQEDDVELERTIGLVGGLAIGRTRDLFDHEPTDGLPVD